MNRIAVLGAGAIGGMLGVLLAEAGHDVTMLASDRTATTINVAGLSLRSTQFGELHVRVAARPWLTEPVDLLFVAVKAPDLLAALTRVPAQLLHGSAIVPLLNGVDHVPLLRAAFPQSAVVPMTVAVEATRVRPGVIEHVSPFADYAISAGHRELVVDPATLLRGAGLEVDFSAPDEATLLWRKLSFLAPLALLTTSAREPLGPAIQARPDLLTALVEEAAIAAAAAEAVVDPAAVEERLRGLPGGMRSSMLKDALAGAPLELDAIAGPILRGPGAAPVTREVVAQIVRAQDLRGGPGA